MPKEILITGASGFLGGVTTKKLLNEGFKVVTGSRAPSKISSYPAYNGSQNIKFDMSDPSTFRSSLKGIDTVVHLAAMNYQDCEANKKQAKIVNKENVQLLCEAAVKEEVNDFIYMSSVHSYGSPLKGELIENRQTEPSNSYSKTHRDAEEIILNFHYLNKLNATIFRLSNSFGVPARIDVSVWNLVAFDICKQIVKNKCIELNSSGIQLRNFIPVKDVASAISFFINKSERMPDPVYNLGTDETMSIIEFTKIAQKAAESKYDCKIPISKKDTPLTCPDFELNIDKIKTAGFTNFSSIENELILLLEYCETNKDLL